MASRPRKKTGSAKTPKKCDLPLAPRPPAAILDHITGCKKVEGALAYRLEFERLIAGLSTRFINLRPDEIDGAVNDALRDIGQFMEVDRSYVFLFREDGLSMDNSHEWCADGIEAHVARLKGLLIADFPCVAVEIRRGEVTQIRVADLGPDRASERTEFEREGIQSLIMVPMSCREKVLGFLGLDAVREERIFSEDSIALLRVAGECLAGALERQRYEETLRRERDLSNRLIETSPSGIVRLDRDGRISFANSRAEQVLGLTRDEINSRTYRDPAWMISTFDGQPLSDGQLPFAQVKATRRPVHDVRHVIERSDGRRVLLSINAAPLVDDHGDFDGMVSTVEDVTERVRAEQALRERTDELDRFFSLAPDLLCIADVDGRFIRLNKTWEDILGYPVRELEGRFFMELVHPDDRAATLASIGQLGEGRNVINFINRYRRKDGSYRFIEWRSSPYGNRLIYAAARDITERLKIQEQLKRSEGQYRFYMEHLQGIAYQVEVGHTRPHFIHGAVEAITGYQPADFLEERIYWDQLVHPDDLPLLVRSNQRISKEPNYVADNEYRIVRKDGSLRRVRDIAQNVIAERDGAAIINGMVWDVTERRQAEQKIREDEARLRSIFRASPVGIGLVSNRVLLQVNDRICEMTGYTERELVGQNARILYATQEDFEFVGREKYRQIRQSGIGTVETRWLRKDGRVIDVLMSSVPLDPNDHSVGVTFTALDITDRKRTEEALRESSEFSRQVIANAQEGIVVLDRKLRYIVWNQFMERFTGKSVDEVIGRSPADVYPFFVDVGIIPNLDRALAGETVVNSDNPILREGSSGPAWTSTVHSPLRNAQGEIIGVIGIIRDITERKRAEEERRHLEAQVQHVQKLESLGVLAGGIAHDFNNLLMAILGNADLAMRSLSHVSPAQNYLRDIETASRRAADLCRQMLAYSGKGRFVVETLNMNEVVEEMTRMLEVSISKKAVLKYNLAANLPTVEADATQMRQVLMNLITNASEAIGERSGIISITTGAMRCDQDYLKETYLADSPTEGMYVYVEVADTGCGMTPEVRSRIFDPFFTTKFTGRGLGMAAVLGIVRGHKGAIKVYSEPGKGTTVKVLFPASEKTAVKNHTKDGTATDWKGSGTVLIVDDEETVRVVTEHMLQLMGYHAIISNDGRAALDIFRKRHAEITCVLLDLTMPHMDGEETYREMRRVDKNVRVIMSSGYSEQEVTQRFVGKGLAGFIQKPFQYEALQAKLREVLGDEKARASGG